MTRAIPLAALLVALLIFSPMAAAFSALSVSQVDFSSNDATLNRPAWLLTVVEDGNQQTARGTFTSEDITRADGATSQRDLTIDIENTKNSCEYSFQNQYTPVYQVDVRDVSGLLPWYNTAEKCRTQYPGTFLALNPGFSGYCLVRTETAKHTPLSTPVTTFESTIKATVAGETVTGKVSNTAQRSVNLGSRVAASWKGNLVTGETCPAPLDTGVTGVRRGTSFIVTSQDAWERYDADQTSLKECAGRVGVGTRAQVQACVDAYNQQAAAVLQRTSEPRFKAAQVFADGAGGGKAVLALANTVQYPVITLRVDAEWIGIVVPVGEPKILDIQASEFTEGTTGNLRVVVKNVGDAKASFSVSAKCTAPADRAGVSRTLALAPGAQGFVDLPITGETDGEAARASCTVTAQDVNQPDNEDTQTVEVKINPLALCAPGMQRCLDRVIETCNAAGTLWVREQVCENACRFEDGAAVCADAEACTEDSECDDGDVTTLDQCAGVVAKQCKHTPLGITKNTTQYLKLGGFVVALLVFIGLGYWLHPAWYVGAAIAGMGVVIGIFALVSTLAAVLFTVGLVLVLAGIGLLQFAPSLGIAALAGGGISIVVGFLVVFL